MPGTVEIREVMAMLGMENLRAPFAGEPSIIPVPPPLNAGPHGVTAPR